MKKLTIWLILTIILMIIVPLFAVIFAESAGMMISIMLFFAVNPLFSAVGGLIAGGDVKNMWMVPLVTAMVFVIGAWLFFGMGETIFVIYGGVYLLIGLVAMVLRNSNKNNK